MKPGPFVYHDPASVGDVVALLAQHEDVKLLAGGQSLMPMLNMRFVVPDHVIDLNGVAGMNGVDDTGEALAIGAMTRQRELAGSEARRGARAGDPGSAFLGRPLSDPQPRHHRWQPVPPRPGGRIADGGGGL